MKICRKLVAEYRFGGARLGEVALVDSISGLVLGILLAGRLVGGRVFWISGRDKYSYFAAFRRDVSRGHDLQPESNKGIVNLSNGFNKRR